MEKNKYRVTCKGMFIAGQLFRKGDVFLLDQENADKLRNRRPNNTFEAVDDNQDKRESPLDGQRQDDGGAGNARLHASSGKSEGPKKRGRGRPRKRE